MTFSARTERRGPTVNQLAAEKHLHKILDKPRHYAVAHATPYGVALLPA